MAEEPVLRLEELNLKYAGGGRATHGSRAQGREQESLRALQGMPSFSFSMRTRHE